MTKSWRDILPIHPAADLFPLMSPDELRTLGEDIKKNGLTSPIAIVTRKDAKDWHYQLLDGRNRLDAMELVGVPFNIMLRHGVCVFIYGDDQVIFNPTVIDSHPYVYVLSANIHRRHLTAEQKRGLTAKLIKATPEKSDRQIAETVKVDHKTVGAVRAEQEARGEIPHVSTRTDSKGRQQPARRVGERHKCWQCGARAAVGEVQQHSYPAYEEVDVWLHDSCVAAFEAGEAECRAQRDAAAERIGALMGKTAPAAADMDANLGAMADDGDTGNGEIARKDARIEELQAEKRRLEIKIVGLESEIAEQRDKLIRNGEGKTLLQLLTATVAAANSIDNWPTLPPAAQKKLGKLIARIRADIADMRQIFERAEKAKAAPPESGDGLDIPRFLQRGAP